MEAEREAKEQLALAEQRVKEAREERRLKRVAEHEEKVRLERDELLARTASAKAKAAETPPVLQQDKLAEGLKIHDNNVADKKLIGQSVAQPDSVVPPSPSDHIGSKVNSSISGPSAEEMPQPQPQVGEDSKPPQGIPTTPLAAVEAPPVVTGKEKKRAGGKNDKDGCVIS